MPVPLFVFVSYFLPLSGGWKAFYLYLEFSPLSRIYVKVLSFEIAVWNSVNPSNLQIKSLLEKFRGKFLHYFV